MKAIYTLTIIVLLILTASCREDIIEFEEDPANSTIFVQTQPRGALIILNNQNTQKYAPAMLTGLKEGNYFITLRLSGYSDTTLTRFVDKNSEVSLNVLLNND